MTLTRALHGLVVLSIAVSTLLACGEGRNEAGGNLRMATLDDVPTLDPAIGYDTRSWMFEEAIFNTLLDYDEASRIVGELAASWQVSENGLTYRFKLRRGVRFTNGRELQAEDVKYSLERVLNPATRSPGAEFYRGIIGSQECLTGPCSVPGIRSTNSYELEFRLEQADPLFLHKLTMPFAAVVPREEVERWGEDFARHVVGSGPFKLARWEIGRRIVLVRNAQYHIAGVPRLQGIENEMGVGEELAWFRYESGDLDVTPIPPAEFPRVIRNPQQRELVRQATSMSTAYLGMNFEIPPFDDVRVRRAINYAVNKQKLLRLINGRGVVARGFLPPTMPGYQAGLRGYPYDPNRARKLLSTAGHPNGFSTTLWVQLDDDSLRMAQGVQQDLRQVGIDLTIRPLAWPPFLEKVRRRGEVPFFRLGWQADYPDPSNFLETLLHSKSRSANNHTFFSDSRLDSMLDRASKATNPEARMKLLQAAERRAVRSAAWVFLYHPLSYVIVHPRVRGLQIHPLRPLRFDQVWIENESATGSENPHGKADH